MIKNIDKFIFNNDKNIDSQSATWNLVASLLNALTSAYLLLFITRYISIEAGGVFVIASTLAYQMLTIGNYSMRNYQATDTLNKFTFKEYLLSRYITSILMALVSVSIIIFNGYDISKSLIILSFILFKWIDAIEDVYHGFYQQHNRLDVACRAQSIRYILSLIFFSICIIIFKDLLISCFGTFVFSFLIFLFINNIIKKKFKFEKTYNKKNIFKLLIECFPLFIGSYLYLYLCNSPKYAIDTVLNDTAQSYFGIIFMPVFIINLISTLIYRPLLTKMANTWNSGEKKNLIHSITKQLTIIFIITIIATIIGYLCGTQILGLIYAVDLNQYKLALAILMIGGGLNAIVGYFLSIITIIRAQKTIIPGYALVSLAAFLFSNHVTKNYQINGASILYVLLLLLLSIYFILIFIHIYNKNVDKRKAKI